MDLLGCCVLAFVTSVGGGTTRDILIGRVPVFWIHSTQYLKLSLCAAVLTFTLVLTGWLALTALWLLIRHERELMATTAREVSRKAKVVGAEVLRATADVLRRTDQVVRRTSMAIRRKSLAMRRLSGIEVQHPADAREAVLLRTRRSSTPQRDGMTHRLSAFSRLIWPCISASMTCVRFSNATFAFSKGSVLLFISAFVFLISAFSTFNSRSSD